MGYIYHENTRLIRDYPEEPVLKWNKAVIIPGQRAAQVDADPVVVGDFLLQQVAHRPQDLVP